MGRDEMCGHGGEGRFRLQLQAVRGRVPARASQCAAVEPETKH